MHFVIAGAITCPQFSYAVMVAQRLKENLPDFTYLKIAKKPEEWEKWLLKTCRENNWYHVKSPIIWREIGLKQGKKDFIGDINKFLDLCYDYYGIPQDVLSAEHFNRGEMNWFMHRTESEFFEKIKLEAERRRKYRSRQVCITGASCPMTEIIVMELLQIELQRREDGLEIRLFDDPTKEKKLMSSANDAKHCPGPSGFGNCRAVTTLKEAFTDIDLVIVLDSFPRKSKESVVKWLKRNRNAMCALGKALNLYAPPHCRVIIGSLSSQPTCYNATVLASFATKLHVRNIVVVTQDLGREMLTLLSKKANVPLKNFYCPPVWGFVGLNKYIDIRRTLQTHLYRVPGKVINSNLPQGTENYELRTSECLISEEDSTELHTKVSDHKAESYPQLGRWPCLAKATAIVDLLKVWRLKEEDGNGEILCLGVYSDGTFNIPQGIYWSQPVILSKGFWVPFADFPIPRSPYFNCHNLFLYSIAAIYRTKVKPRIYIFPKKVLKPKENKRFNFDKIAEEVGMPVIRTDAECVTHLKQLTENEFGIDLDAVLDSIEEEGEEEKEEKESEILPEEEVVPKQIFCECWRQELKELQKIVLTRSSTTEVEVDLSENISGSEWSVINFPSHTAGDVGDLTLDKGEGTKMDYSMLIKSSKVSHTPSTVCSCGSLSTGSICQCLDVPESLMINSTDEKLSTEHFYKEQNAEIFDEDLKDVIYADNYTEAKRVTFDPDAKQTDENGFHIKLCGKKGRVRDLKADLKMQRRIHRYELSGEESIEEEECVIGEREGSWTPLEKLYSDADVTDSKFQITAEGRRQSLIGNQDGTESPEGIDKTIKNESAECLKNISADEVMPSTDVLPADIEKSTESSEKDVSFPGETYFTFGGSFKSFPELTGEVDGEGLSMTSLENDLNTVWEQGLFHEETGEVDEDEEKKEFKIKRKKEGIPLCCLCRCLVPEGLPCCPCGASTVVEVFKKESIEVFVQSEDDVSYKLEYFETDLTQGSEISKESNEPAAEEEQQPSLQQKELPPESFHPFFPKQENKFSESIRPFELTKDYADSFKKTEKEIPPKCLQLLLSAKTQLEGKVEVEGENDRNEEDEIEEEGRDKKDAPPVCGDIDLQIKTDFSDLKLFIPCGLEDWRLTVQKKYREWFFQGPEIKDESYYDIAVEDVSEDEFEFDKEMEQFFER